MDPRTEVSGHSDNTVRMKVCPSDKFLTIQKHFVHNFVKGIALWCTINDKIANLWNLRIIAKTIVFQGILSGKSRNKNKIKRLGK